MNITERNTLRRNILTVRDRLSDHERAQKSASAVATILCHPLVVDASVMFTYVHFRSEVQTLDLIHSLLAAGKTVTVPHTLKEVSRLLAVRITDPESQLEPGYCGIPEPLPSLVEQEVCPPGDIDVVIVPGSVFDRKGGRLGYGGGFYDRFLSVDAPRAVRIGLAYELQLVERVPVEAHDQFMDFLVTEDKLYDCGRDEHAPNSRVPG